MRSLRLVLAVLLGCLVGKIFGPKASVLGEMGMLLIRVLKTLATPLIFFAIVDTFNRTSIRARRGVQLLAISLINAAVAAGIALTISPLFSFIQFKLPENIQSSESVSYPGFDFIKILEGFIPQNIFEPFLNNNVLTIVVCSIFIGLGVRTLKQNPERQTEFQVFEKFFGGGLHVIQNLLTWFVRWIPLALFGVVAKVVGMSGFSLVSGLGAFVLVVILAMVIHVGVYYTFVLKFIARISPVEFFRNAYDPLLTAFSSGSSLATLPGNT